MSVVVSFISSHITAILSFVGLLLAVDKLEPCSSDSYISNIADTVAFYQK